MKPKMSAMLLAVAEEFIALGHDTSDKQQRLFGAVSAWNIACLAPAAREPALQQFLAGYRDLDPGQTPQDIAAVEHDMRELIRKKLQTYPKVRTQIVDAQLQERDGRLHVLVAAVRR